MTVWSTALSSKCKKTSRLERVKKLIFEVNPAMPLRQDCEIFRDFFSCIHLRSN